MVDKEEKIKENADILLKNIKENRDKIKEVHIRLCRFESYAVNRFYFQSVHVMQIEEQTEKAVELIKSLLPSGTLNDWFTQIISEGTRKEFSHDWNDDWPKHTRTIMEAFFHTQHFIRLLYTVAENINDFKDGTEQLFEFLLVYNPY